MSRVSGDITGNVDVLVAVDAAQVLDQRFKVVYQRCAVLGAEHDMKQVERVGVGHISNLRGWLWISVRSITEGRVAADAALALIFDRTRR